MCSPSPTPGDLLRRLLPTEAEQRGTRFVSAQAMQARLFSVYDAAAAAEDALALVQHQLTLTLNRSYYEASEIETMAVGARCAARCWTPSTSARKIWSRRSSRPVGPAYSASFLTVAMRSTGRWSPIGSGVTCRWVTPASLKAAIRSAT